MKTLISALSAVDTPKSRIGSIRDEGTELGTRFSLRVRGHRHFSGLSVEDDTICDGYDCSDSKLLGHSNLIISRRFEHHWSLRSTKRLYRCRMSTNFNGSAMAPDTWDNADGVSEGGGAGGGYMQQHTSAIQPQQRHTSHEDQLDRQMLRHLMSKYTAEDLSRLMQEENSSTHPSRRIPILLFAPIILLTDPTSSRP